MGHQRIAGEAAVVCRGQHRAIDQQAATAEKQRESVAIGDSQRVGDRTVGGGEVPGQIERRLNVKLPASMAISDVVSALPRATTIKPLLMNYPGPPKSAQLAASAGSLVVPSQIQYDKAMPTFPRRLSADWGD